MSSITSRLTRVCTSALFLASLVAGVALAVAGHQVPLKGTGAGSVVGAVPSGSSVLLTIHASGTASQLGRYDRVEEVLFDPATGSLSGSIVFFAAGGAELHVTVAGGFISPTTAVGTYTITGGTGRFEGATGSATFEAVSADGVQVSVSFSGTISSVGG